LVTYCLYYNNNQFLFKDKNPIDFSEEHHPLDK